MSQTTEIVPTMNGPLMTPRLRLARSRRRHLASSGQYWKVMGVAMPSGLPGRSVVVGTQQGYKQQRETSRGTPWYLKQKPGPIVARVLPSSLGALGGQGLGLS